MVDNTSSKKSVGFSDFEREAMKNRAKELRAEERWNKNKAEGEKDLLAVIDSMSEPDKSMATKIHKIVMEAAPEIFAKTWYGMPAYADKEGKAICFFQGAGKFKARYATLGFNDNAKLDEGDMWSTAFAIMKLTPEIEAKISSLVKKAIT